MISISTKLGFVRNGQMKCKNIVFATENLGAVTFPVEPTGNSTLNSFNTLDIISQIFFMVFGRGWEQI